jgi:hypothetical protein
VSGSPFLSSAFCSARSRYASPFFASVSTLLSPSLEFSSEDQPSASTPARLNSGEKPHLVQRQTQTEPAHSLHPPLPTKLTALSRRGMATYMGRDISKLKAKGGKWKYMTESEMLSLASRFSPYRYVTSRCVALHIPIQRVVCVVLSCVVLL